MKQTHKLILLLLLSLATAVLINSCANLGNMFKNPEAKIISVELIQVDFTSLSLEVMVEISNPNPVGITLSAYDYGLTISEKTLLEGRFEEPISLKENGSTTVPVPIKMTYKDIPSIGAAIQTGKSLPVGIELGLEITFPYMGGLRMDISGSVEIPILRRPVLQPQSIRVERINLSGADILLSIKVENPNEFTLTLDTAEGNLTVSDNEWGRISAESDVSIPPHESSIINLRMQVDFVEAGRSAFALLTGNGNANIRINGTMDIDMDLPEFKGEALPWNSEAKVSILR